MTARRAAPWPDFAGNTIHEGDTIAHPSGERGVVVFDDSESSASSYGQWRVQYEAGMPSLALQLQIGWKGMAVVANPGALQTDTPLARIENALRQAGWLNCDPEDWEAVRRELEIEQIKRQVAEARFERAVDILTAIHGQLAPPMVDMPDGQKLCYQDPDAAAALQRISDRIRAIPVEIDRARGAKAMAFEP